MKRLFYFFIGIAVFLSACKKEEDAVFNQSPDDRINEALAKYQAQLTGAENGWKGFIRNSKGQTYAFYFVFTNDNRVKMLSDFTAQSAITLQDAGYRFREQQQPTFIFDTYSYIHVLADPNEANTGIFADVNISRPTVLNTWYYKQNDLPIPDISKGLQTDFEFIVDESLIQQDTIRMIGKTNGSLLTFVRATKAEADIFNAGKWNSSLVGGYLNKEFLTYYSRLAVNGNLFDVHSYSDSTLMFSWLDGNDSIIYKEVGFTQTVSPDGFTHGIRLLQPVNNGTININTLNITSWDATTRTLNITANNTAGTLTETTLPLKIDTTLPSKWINFALDNGGYWASWDGFYVNGTRDAYNNNKDGINTRYFYLSYFPADVLGSQYNALAPIFLNSTYTTLTLDYIQEMPFTDSLGYLKFSLQTNFGYPTTGDPGLTLSQFIIPEGYYLVRLDDGHYDMVSAKDGKAWLSWFF
ncbi:DUF4302 domain-containing protein [Ferruginibacter albus]|uniref:DUF4302 domain-containing protein n=1 Tax=Ferruginibacter albus TaxID=2875540 RepID=UPI001CC3BA18|nr:DUF4302 domain-containing protein [Ferruginibacter albus]UAY50779.1 DUF4302 domain-containing protein [Ferruginibacter albus]